MDDPGTLVTQVGFSTSLMHPHLAEGKRQALLAAREQSKSWLLLCEAAQGSLGAPQTPGGGPPPGLAPDHRASGKAGQVENSLWRSFQAPWVWPCQPGQELGPEYRQTDWQPQDAAQGLPSSPHLRDPTAQTQKLCPAGGGDRWGCGEEETLGSQLKAWSFSEVAALSHMIVPAAPGSQLSGPGGTR